MSKSHLNVQIKDGPQGGRSNLEEAIAYLSGVQNRLMYHTLDGYLSASVGLARHRLTGWARVGFERWKLDGYVFLEDRAGANHGAAYAIEMGHHGYKVEEVDEETGKKRVWKVPPAPGLHILHDAFGLRAKKGKKPKMKTVKRVKGRASGRPTTMPSDAN